MLDQIRTVDKTRLFKKLEEFHCADPPEGVHAF